MYQRLVSFVYWMNLIMQSLFCLVTPVALMTGVSYLLVRYAGVGEWIYAVLILVGTGSGIVSMVRYILTVSENIRRFEESQNPEASGSERREPREKDESRDR